MLIDVAQLLHVVPQRLIGVSETVLPLVAPYLKPVTRQPILAIRLGHRAHATRRPHELHHKVAMAFAARPARLLGFLHVEQFQFGCIELGMQRAGELGWSDGGMAFWAAWFRGCAHGPTLPLAARPSAAFVALSSKCRS